MRGFLTRTGLLAAACCSALAIAPPPGVAATPVHGTSADFADSIGVQTHGFYGGSHAHHARVEELLVDLGVKHVRDGVRLGHASEEYEWARSLAARGIKFMWGAGDPRMPHDPKNPHEVIDALTDPARLAGTTDAIEGPNEFDKFHAPPTEAVEGAPRDLQLDRDSRCPVDRLDRDLAWASELYAFMARAYPHFKADPRLGGFPVYGPSFLGWGGLCDYAAMPGSGTLMDAPNIHPYGGGGVPEGAIEDQARLHATLFGDPERVPVISEAGYNTAVNSQDGTHHGVSERAQSIYIARTVLKGFQVHAPRTYLYQLLDEKPDPGRTVVEDQFGLVATESSAADESYLEWVKRPKQAYGTLKEIIEMTRDTGTGSGPQALSFDLSGEPEELEQVLLSRSDGSVDLVLWNAVEVYNRATWDCSDPRIPPAEERPAGYTHPCDYARKFLAADNGDAFPADVPVTLRLGERAHVSTERPHSERSFTSLGTGRTFNLDVGADPIFIRISEPTYGMSVLADGPVAFLRLGESSGAPADSAGHATTNAWSAAPTYSQPGAVGDGDTAVRVGPGQRTTFTVPPEGAPHTASGATIELWAKPDTGVPNEAKLISAASSTNPSQAVHVRTKTPGLGVAHGSRPGETGDLQFPFAAGQWHHVVLTVAGDLSTSTVYVNGQLKAQRGGLLEGGDWFDLVSFTIGAHADDAGFKGVIDEVAAYPKALTASQVCAHYRAGGGSC